MYTLLIVLLVFSVILSLVGLLNKSPKTGLIVAYLLCATQLAFMLIVRSTFKCHDVIPKGELQVIVYDMALMAINAFYHMCYSRK